MILKILPEKIIKYIISLGVLVILIYELGIGTAKYLHYAKNHAEISNKQKIYDISSTAINSVIVIYTATNLYQMPLIYYTRFGIAMFNSSALVLFAKHVIKSERPDKSNNKSFPSGHANIGFVSLFFLTKTILPNNINDKKERNVYNIIFLSMFIAVCILRVVSLRHNLIDVIAACFIGLLSCITSLFYK